RNHGFRVVSQVQHNLPDDIYISGSLQRSACKAYRVFTRMSELAALPARTVLGDGLLPVGADGPPCPRRYSSHLDFHNNAPCDKTLQQIQGDQERLDPGLRPCIAAGDNRYAQRIHTGQSTHRTASCIVPCPSFQTAVLFHHAAFKDKIINATKRSRRTAFLYLFFDSHHQIHGFNSISCFHEHFTNLAVKWRFDGVLHLHRFGDYDDIPFFEFISCLEFDCADRPRHLGADMADVSRIRLFQFCNFGLDVFILDIYFSRESVELEVHPTVAVLVNMPD